VLGVRRQSGYCPGVRYHIDQIVNVYGLKRIVGYRRTHPILSFKNLYGSHTKVRPIQTKSPLH